MNQDTIAAIATPAGSGGIGIIKLSGSQALAIASTLFGRTKTGPEDCARLLSHSVNHGYIFDSEAGVIIDEVLLIPMIRPRSYTAEDVVEIQAHSGPMVMRTILDQVLKSGARLAEPGEFTKRAFLNGRIDLSQAEAVMDIINARSSNAVKLAAAIGTGTLKEQIQEHRDRLIRLLSEIEAAIDFPDETQDLIPEGKAMAVVTTVLDACQNFIQQYDDAHFLRDGIKLAICGPPNVGKSSLMNRLLARERSIVTAIPGTTRDLIEESITIQGIPFIISDTAGMHQTDDLVEKIGIEKAKKHILQSDLILYMKEAGSAVTLSELEAIVPRDKKMILVFNKIDLPVNQDITAEIPDSLESIPKIRISALNNEGIDELRKMITEMFFDSSATGSSVVPNLRHKRALEKAVTSLELAMTNFSDHPDEESAAETLAIDIRDATDALGEILGETTGIDILDTIFSTFCIGK